MTTKKNVKTAINSLLAISKNCNISRKELQLAIEEYMLSHIQDHNPKDLIDKVFGEKLQDLFPIHPGKNCDCLNSLTTYEVIYILLVGVKNLTSQKDMLKNILIKLYKYTYEEIKNEEDFFDWKYKKVSEERTPMRKSLIVIGTIIGSLELVKQSFKSHVEKDDYLEAMILAAKEGNFQIIKFILESKRYNPADFQEDSRLALEFACSNGHLEIVKILVAYGIDPKSDYRTEDTENMLCVFGENDEQEIITPENCRHMCFRNAIEGGHLEVVKYLFDGGHYSQGNMDTGPRIAAYHQRLDILKYLVEKGANFHYDNERALQWACQKGDEEIIQYLLSVGADLSASPNFLLFAVDAKHFQIANFLMDKGVDILWSLNSSYWEGLSKCNYFLTRQLIKRYPEKVKEAKEYLTNYQKKKYDYLLGANDFNLI